MASISLSPSPVSVGQFVTMEGLDFTASSVVTITVQSPLGRSGIFYSQITADASGEVASTDIANYATTTYTLSSNAAAADTITLGAVTYTWRASVSTTANEILLGSGGSAVADSLANLKAAINLSGGASPTQYGSLTVVHPTVRASAITATTLLIVAKTPGTGGNSLASTKTGVNGSFTGATLSGGAAASGNYTWSFAPTTAGIWTISATDGTNTASANLTVWHSA